MNELLAAIKLYVTTCNIQAGPVECSSPSWGFVGTAVVSPANTISSIGIADPAVGHIHLNNPAPITDAQEAVKTAEENLLKARKKLRCEEATRDLIEIAGRK